MGQAVTSIRADTKARGLWIETRAGAIEWRREREAAPLPRKQKTESATNGRGWKCEGIKRRMVVDWLGMELQGETGQARCRSVHLLPQSRRRLAQSHTVSKSSLLCGHGLL